MKAVCNIKEFQQLVRSFIPKMECSRDSSDEEYVSKIVSLATSIKDPRRFLRIMEAVATLDKVEEGDVYTYVYEGSSYFQWSKKLSGNSYLQWSKKLSRNGNIQITASVYVGE